MRVRFVQLLAGLVLYGVSSSLLVLAGLGLDPWDVFHQGLARHSSLAIGTWAILVGVVVLLLWIPLRQRPYLVGSYERAKTPVIAQTTTINTLGVNYRLRPTVSFKVEYRYGSHNALVAPDGWLASFAVLF